MRRNVLQLLQHPGACRGRAVARPCCDIEREDEHVCVEDVGDRVSCACGPEGGGLACASLLVAAKVQLVVCGTEAQICWIVGVMKGGGGECVVEWEGVSKWEKSSSYSRIRIRRRTFHICATVLLG